MNDSTGRQLWKILHTFASNYPERPTIKDQVSAKRFFGGFLEIVHGVSNGCDCGRDLQLMVVLAPPELSGCDALTRYAAALHDAVNMKLGKPLSNDDSKEHAVFKVMEQRLGGADIKPPCKGCGKA